MGLPAQTVEGIRFGSLIHDLDKIQVPAQILAKPTRLTNLEFELIKIHAQAGHDILKGIEFPWPVAAMVLQHHERAADACVRLLREKGFAFEGATERKGPRKRTAATQGRETGLRRR